MTSNKANSRYEIMVTIKNPSDIIITPSKAYITIPNYTSIGDVISVYIWDGEMLSGIVKYTITSGDTSLTVFVDHLIDAITSQSAYTVDRTSSNTFTLNALSNVNGSVVYIASLYTDELPLPSIETYSFDFVEGSTDYDYKSYMLDLYDEEMITFDSSVCEIQDITTRNSTFSKTITIPDTNHNRKVFGFVSGLNADATLYNPNKRADCVILIDTIPVFVGTIQLKRVVNNFRSGEVKLETIFFSNVLDFYKNMGDKYLVDLDGMTAYNHKYDAPTIVNSWTQSQNHGYYYPLMDYGKLIGPTNQEIPNGFSNRNIGSFTGSVIVEQLYPAVYVKTLVDQIFTDAGYQYDSNFFDSTFFKNLIVPFTNKNLKSGNTMNLAPITRMSGTASTYQYTSYNSSYNAVTINGLQYSTNGIVGDTQVFHLPNMYDTGVTKDTVSYYFENITGSTIHYKPLIDVKFYGFIRNKRLSWYVLKAGQTNATLIAWVIIEYMIPGYTYDKPTGNLFYSSNGYTDPATWNIGGGRGSIVDTSLVDGFYSLQPGDKAFVTVLDLVPISIPLPYNDMTLVDITVKHVFGDFVRAGDTIDMQINLPANIKQKDFITNIFKMFNLYVEQDKLIPNTLRIEPRDDYYKYSKDTTDGSPIIKNWTDKINLDKEIIMDILSDTQDKTFTYTYKEGKDYFNSLYKSNTNRIQGDMIKEIDNDFNTGDKKVEVFFEPSVLANIPGYTNFPIVNMAKQVSEITGYPVGSSDTGIRILQKASNIKDYKKYGCVDLIYGDTWRFGPYTGASASLNTTYDYYPYAGNYDDPYNPQFDLSFDQPLVSFYYQSNIVNNNLFNIFHKNQFDQLTDVNSRIVTCEMYLTPTDMAQFYFNDIIYIELGGQGNYFTVNSIKNYDPSGKSTCTVELLLMKYYKSTFNTTYIDWKFDIEGNKTILIHARAPIRGSVNWGDGNISSFVSDNGDALLSNNYLSAGTYSVTITYNNETDLYGIDLSNNDLVEVDLTQLPLTITDINLNGNNIDPSTTSYPDNTQILDLSNTGIDLITANNIVWPVNLVELYLNDNNIAGLLDGYELPETLKKFDVSNNPGLEGVVSSMFPSSLDYYNQSECNKDLSPTTTLVVNSITNSQPLNYILDFSYNSGINVVNIDFGTSITYPNLSTLTFEGCVSAHSILGSGAILPNLTTLSLKDTGFSGNLTITNYSLPNLKYFDISGTSITTLDMTFNNIIDVNNFIYNTGLVHLYFNNNEIIEFDPTIALPSGLLTITLEYNQLTSFDPSIALPSGLNYLSIRNNNQLTSFDPSIALPSSLYYLFLNNNQLTSFDPTIALPSNLHELYLDHNQLTYFNSSLIINPIYILNVSYNNLSVTDINNILIQLDTNGLSNGLISTNNQTPSAPPSGAGITAKNNLIAKGWTVATD